MWLGTGKPFGITGECKEGGSRGAVGEASRDQVEGQWGVVGVVEEFWKREEPPSGACVGRPLCPCSGRAVREEGQTQEAFRVGTGGT